jgi:non-specific serine/threonine protein kinase/serine/threonine-protein kinase
MSSSHERWPQVKALFNAALEKDAVDRDVFLEAACAGDEVLRQEVERLLQAHDAAGTFIDAPAVSLVAGDHVESRDDLGRVGAYEIVGSLGEGGMGTVFRAVRADDVYHKQVALKVVKRGMDSDEVVERFRRERELLATLDHPNIARLVDGGATADGRPYFVMDYVEGTPIDEYCDANGIDIDARLKLFREVCAGVQYAHRNLVVHRDIKPDNIHVTSEGVPKLLDFGIAKLLDPAHPADFDLTRAHGSLMTPAYASPEQVRREPISTATDIYSLGVLLHRLLAGVLPYSVNGLSATELERVICEYEPPPPSAVARLPRDASDEETVERARDRSSRTKRLRRRLVGDLDTIVATALRKEPEHRYSSVERLSDDIRRFLEGLPVTARPTTVGYRVRKFVRRNRPMVAAAALVFVSLLGGLLSTAWQAKVAERNRMEAEQRFNQVRRLANTFVFELHDAVEKLPGSTPVRELMVKRGLEYLDSLAAKVGDDPVLLEELAAAYVKMGEVQGHPQYSNLGRPTEALNSYRKALVLRARIGRRTSKERLQLAQTYRVVGDLLETTGDTAAAVAQYRASIAELEQLVALEPSNQAFRRDLAIAYSSLADRLGNPVFQHLGDPKQAQELYVRALAIFERLAAEQPGELRPRRNVALVYERVAGLAAANGDLRAAEQTAAKAVAMHERNHQDPRATPQHQRDLSTSLQFLGSYLVAQGRLDEGLQYIERSLKLSERLLAGDPENTMFRTDVAVAHTRIGALLAHPDYASDVDLKSARPHYERAIQLSREVFESDTKSVGARRNLYAAIQELGDVYLNVGRHQEALAAYRTAVEGMLPWGSRPGADPSARSHLALAHTRFAAALARTGSIAEARDQYAKAMALWTPLVDAKQVPVDGLRFVAEAWKGLGDITLAGAGRGPSGGDGRREARQLYARARDLLQDLDRRGLLAGRLQRHLTEVAEAAARTEAAVRPSIGRASLDRSAKPPQ